MSDLSDIRREYSLSHLSEEMLPQDPMSLFESWMEFAKGSGLKDPTAMTVATVDESGQPFQRIVLLKRFDADGFVFFTNLASRKAKQIADNSKVSLHFPWHGFERQVQVLGEAEKISRADVLKYFLTRPKDSQIAAWVSKQSSKISTRQVLMQKFEEMKTKYAKGEVPLPDFWGGYRIKPTSIEFWQGGESRLHDRFVYEKGDAGWSTSRLAP